MKCPQCNRTVTKYQIVRIEWRKTKTWKDMCPFCLKDYVKEQIRTVKISPSVLLMMKNTLGMEEVDVINYLKQWNKNQFETF